MLDIHEAQKTALIKTLMLYKLRADVKINEMPHMHVYFDKDEGLPDPRGFGYRIYSEKALDATDNYEALRIGYGYPEYPNELVQDRSIILEYNFEKLNGISFRKGCFLGPELMARTKHLGQLRKQMYVLKIVEGMPKAGEDITNENGINIGTIKSIAQNYCLAILQNEHITQKLKTMESCLEVVGPEGFEPSTT